MFLFVKDFNVFPRLKYSILGLEIEIINKYDVVGLVILLFYVQNVCFKRKMELIVHNPLKRELLKYFNKMENKKWAQNEK